MFSEHDLQFLRDIFKKNRLNTKLISPRDPLFSVFSECSDSETVEGLAGTLQAKTLYKLTDAYGLCYFFLALPSQGGKILFIGPYLPSPFSSEVILEFAEKNTVSPKNVRYLTEYYQAVPVLETGNLLISVLNTFCERLWDSPSFSIVDLSSESSSLSPTPAASVSADSDDILVSMKAMELRYSFENDIMQAVALGQLHKESQLLSSFSNSVFEQRADNPLRNAKNYSIIMNTILRKAAENGGVHPVYIDALSSSFAKKIEQLGDVDETSELMCDMFRSYCRLVRKHAIKDYSPIVQKTMLIIDSDMSTSVSLASLAARQNISSGYLSAIFKKETGITVSEYIRKKRIDHAIYLLSTTHLQIQTVALHCGIMDVQYFSKIFKKQTGKTPKEYRESIKQQKTN